MHQEGFLGIAAELVDSDTRYQKVRHHLLGNVLIARDLQSANHIATLTNRSFRIVTIEGDMVYPGGSMSGGAKKKNNQSLFTREKEIQVLTNKLNDYRSRASAFEHKVMEQKDKVEEIEQSMLAMEREIQAQKELLENHQKELHDLT